MPTDDFPAGTAVRVARRDPNHHNRVPAYIRGASGSIKFKAGHWKSAELVAQGIPCKPEPVYCVEFDAFDLFGEGSHKITVDVWESWLTKEEADDRSSR